MIKAVIFDFFGVIVGDGFSITYQKAGGDPVKDRDFIEKLLDQANRGQISSDEFRNRFCKRLGITVDEYVKAVSRTELINQELLDYVDTLHKKYKTAILSNANVGSLERRIERAHLDRYFDALIVSAEVGYVKPEPEIYNLAAKKLGVNLGECVFIDDREPYVQAAKSAGMKTIHYHDFKQMKAELEKILSPVADN